jgi:6-pyruvoyltetrahydropterin/6-carboxytetrahydropterin synthase
MEFDGTSIIKVTKEITFDSAHMLTDYDGKCENLHGHTYKLLVTLQAVVPSAEQQKITADKKHTWHPSGMVIDFGKLKAALEDEVVKLMDHAFLYNLNAANNSPEIQIWRVLQKSGLKTLGFKSRTTAENMAREIFDILEDRISTMNDGVHVAEVKLYETPTSYVTVERSSR